MAKNNDFVAPVPGRSQFPPTGHGIQGQHFAGRDGLSPGRAAGLFDHLLLQTEVGERLFFELADIFEQKPPAGVPPYPEYHRGRYRHNAFSEDAVTRVIETAMSLFDTTAQGNIVEASVDGGRAIF